MSSTQNGRETRSRSRDLIEQTENSEDALIKKLHRCNHKSDRSVCRSHVRSGRKMGGGKKQASTAGLSAIHFLPSIFLLHVFLHE